MDDNVVEVMKDPGSSRQRNLYLGLGAGVFVIACCCLLAIGLFVAFDPLGWMAW